MKRLFPLLALLLLATPAAAQMGGSGFFGRMKDCNVQVAVNQTASATLITGTAGQRIYVCSILLVSAGAQLVSLVEGTGTNCATGVAALIGGTSASLSLAADSGFSTIAPFGWLSTQTTGNNLCLLQSGTGNISGTVSYRKQ